MRKIHNKLARKRIYLLLALLWYWGSTSSCLVEYYTPSSTVSYTGTTTYCQGATATPNTLNYNQCTLGGGLFTSGVTCTGQWYYNTTGGTSIATSTPYGAAFGFTTPGVSTGTTGSVLYTPSTATVGTFYYFFYATWAAGSTCGSPFTSTTQMITINPTVGTISGSSVVCQGSPITLTVSATGGTWSSSTPGVATVGPTTGIVTGVSFGTATISYSTGVGCPAVKVVSVNPAPPAFSVTPASASFCTGSQLLTAPASAGTTTTTTFNSTSAFGVPDNTPGGASNNITVSGIPVLASIADVSVKLNNVSMTYDGDLTFNIVAPNGSNLNLVNQEGGGGANFTNTVISSLGGGALGAGGAPFTGTFAADAAIGVGPSASPSSVSTWAPLFSTPNGTWTLAARDYAAGDVATVNNWSVIIHYTTPAINYTWAPTTGLYTNAALTIPYTGTITNTVYASPTSTTTYTATAVYAGYTCPSTATSTITISGAYAPITGTPTVCVGANTTLADVTGGANWTSSSPNATVGLTTGIVTGMIAGTAIISYGTGACASTKVVTVNPNPPAIAGVFTVCSGSNITLTNTSLGGTWTSSNTAVGTIGASSGILAGVGVSGTTTVTYTLPTSCYVTAVVTVNPIPAAITGPSNVCIGATITLGNTVTGGTWTSSNTAIGTVGAANGVVGGISTPSVTITYTAVGGCYTTTVVTVNTAPTPITGNMYVCVGQATALGSTPSGVGTWTSTNTAAGTVNASTGVVTGIASGTTNITYSLGGGCTVGTTVTVNPIPAVIGGNVPVCVGSTVTLTDATGTGTWSSSGAGGSIGAANGVLTGTGVGGNPVVTYTLPPVAPAPAGCYITATTTVNPLPNPITGTLSVCVGSGTGLGTTTVGATWSSSAPLIANIDVTTGYVTGLSAGTATITCFSPAGCTITAIFTVNPVPAFINGSLNVCEGSCNTLTDASPGGTWSSSTTGIATIGSANGVLCGAFAGNAVITYQFTATGCYTVAVATVNPVPAPISGSTSLCVGTTSTLSTAISGATWTSSNANATVGSSSGVVTGVTAGTATITCFTLSGCSSTVIVTVNTLPAAITGALSVCVGTNTTLATTTPGCSWSSISANVTVGASSGIVTGVSAGTATIVCTTSSGCTTSVDVTVNPLPASIGGPLTVCVGYTTTLTDATPGGTWSGILPATGSATIGAINGVVTGNIGGTVTITYTEPIAGCKTTAIVTVNPLPGAITGILHACEGASTTLSNSVPGGAWSSGDVTIATVGAANGVVTGVNGGAGTGNTVSIIYTLGSGCTATATYTVNPLPGVISGSLIVCAGSSTPLSTSTVGATWSSSNLAVATVGSASGVVSGISAGTVTIVCYTPAGCTSSVVVTVNPLPAGITGALTLCPLTTTTLADVSPSGSWSTTSANVTVDPVTGVVTGVTAGTAVISYSLLATGCYRTTTVTVNPLPAAIAGTTFSVCSGSAILLSDPTPAGTWSSSTIGIATIGSSSGIVTGGPAGSTTITYKLTATGCYITTQVTVNPLPSPIAGTLEVCKLSTITLTDVTASGTWSAASANVTVGSASGSVTGVNVGTAKVTYTLPTGCIATAIVTVDPLPVPISGTLTVCPGLTTTLTNTSGAGTWSSSAPGTATIGSSNGIVTGVAAGTVTDTFFWSPTGCMATAVVTVNPLPSGITGGLAVCSGLTTTVSDPTPGGSWSSSNSTIAAIGSSNGVITGGIAGTAIITYTLSGTGCYTTSIVTVNGLPAVIGGTLNVCPGTTATLADATTGGTWSLGAPATGAASVVSGTGVVTGIAAGTMTIVYTVGTGCINTGVLTINPLPSAISGALGVCFGLTTTLSDATPGGTWSSSNAAVAPVTSGGGVVSGLSVGTATITYQLTATGCYITDVATVNPLPGPITGSAGFCNLTTTTLHDITPGGTWSSLDPTVAAIDPALGDITGVSVGTVTVVYTLPTGCIASRLETVILAPFPITGPSTVCQGSTVTLGNIIAGGTWVSTTPPVATVGLFDGDVFGISTGTTDITYTLSTGCFSTQVMTVDLTPVAITGPFEVCFGLTTTMGETTPGGAWSSTDPTIAPIDGFGVVSGLSVGSAVISYTMPTGCNAIAGVTVNPLPAPITGTFEICFGLTTTLGDASPGGTWSSGNTFVAMAIPASGVIAGVGVGIAPITYTLPTGCIMTQDMTVDPLPAPITGNPGVCVGLTTALFDITPSGVWSSSDPSIASIDASGVVTGIADGTAIITYMIPTGCLVTVVFTVNALPPAVTGQLAVCPGFTGHLYNAVIGGTWTSDASAIIGYVNLNTGVVTGVSPGTMNITYTLPTGCISTAIETINVLPSPIYGTFELCAGAVATVADIDVGGTWTSSNTAVGTVDLVTGIISGLSAGVTEISYTFVTTGCTNRVAVTVDPLPAGIVGSSVVCQGSILTLSDATPGGAWSSSITAVASFVDPTYGYLTAYAPGVTTVTYANTITHCSVTKAITVNPVPAIITGPSGICLGSTVLLTDSTAGGTWSSSNVAVAPIGVTSGVVSGLTLGSALITYKLGGTGCLRTKLMTVNPLPAVHTVTGGGSYCAGGNGVHVGLNGSDIGISYALYYGASATGYLAGTGAPLDFGLLTPGGVYTVLATNAISGCTKNMLGSATVIINPTVVPGVGITSGTGTDTVCPGAPTTFYAHGTDTGTAPSYIWKVNGTTVATSHNYNFLPANGDVLKVYMTSSANCVSPATASDSMKITLLQSGLPVATVAADPGDTVCEFTPTMFTASSYYGGYGPLYTWFVNGSNVGSGTTYSYTPNDGDIISLRLVSNYQCRTKDTVVSSNVTMSVHPLLIPHVEIMSNPGLSVDTGQVDSLSTIVVNAGSHPAYQWQINGIPVAGATNSWYVGTFHDYDSVNCMVTSSDVCHGVSTFDWVFISLHPTTVTSVTAGFGDIRLVPNPNKGAFSIKGSLGTTVDEDYEIEVTDMLGQIVYKAGAQARKGKIDEFIQLSNAMANGMYMLNLRSVNQSRVFHFVVEQ